MTHKIIVVPFDNGSYAKILFTQQENGDWSCKMSNQMMCDLQALANGEELKEIVTPYLDIDLIDKGSKLF